MDQLVDAIRIPRDGGRLGIARIPLTLLSKKDIDAGPYEASELQHYLKRVPDLMKNLPIGDDWRAYSWDFRSLVSLGDMNPDQTPDELSERRGPYFMYICYQGMEYQDFRGHEFNEHFTRVLAGKAVVHGDVFIFKVKEHPFDRFGMVRYDALDDDIIKHAFNGHGIDSDEGLKWLAEQERKWFERFRF